MTAARLDQHRLAGVLGQINAPDVVIACSRRGERMIAIGGTARRDPVMLANLHYEIGSASKTFTGLLLARLTHLGVLGLADPLTWHLRLRQGHAHRDAITLFHLITHTSGLPRLPRDLYRHGLPRWFTNPYAGYTTEQLITAFAGTRPSGEPGRRWHYSNFGVALLGAALAYTTATPFDQLLSREILGPLGLAGTALSPWGPAYDAVGHGYRTHRTVPPFDAGAFAAAGAVRATPGDLLTYLEAHLNPNRVLPLSEALRTVRRTAVRRGFRHQHTHTLAWFEHPYADGSIFFHAGATPGQEAFLGFRPSTGTAVVALGTRRYRVSSGLGQRAYELLT
ncbi:serine hydrolase domain-containing protein [Actinophytocola oryzae]|uniref:CubicO group peptidase (Beta-lactamase class C family) n=1 Tax=Actinophytocola oryzae TaxID=502181 RepID=A0A4R7VD31_9PSEU|nr:serine hydrolase domain-containing protein [Actinophytocola oryzae]TDV46879.1 CubicO group peptidase (beta-lactamase class C family) [Actinophytocola oryzae]